MIGLAPQKSSGLTLSSHRRNRLRCRQLNNLLVRSRQPVFFPRNFPNRFRIALQILYVLLQSQVFLVQFLQFLADLLNLLPLLPHRQVAMRTENVVHQQHRHEYAHQVRRIVQQTFLRISLQFAHQSFKIQSEASFTSFAAPASLSASTYNRSSGSVPLNRSNIQLPSSNTNFAPSMRSTDTTFLPSSVVASTAAFRIAFAFCSSLKCKFSRTG